MREVVAKVPDQQVMTDLDAVVAWAGAGSLDLVLRDVARMASAPRGR